MLKVYSVKQIKDAENKLLESGKLTEDDLIERAAQGLFSAIKEFNLNAQRTLIFAGKGNNGGDGIALAKLLYDEKKDVKIVKLFGELNEERLRKANIKESEFEAPTLIVDAIFGTGLVPKIKEKEKAAIDELNFLKEKFHAAVLAVDIPSGLMGDLGTVNSACVNADYTVCLGGLKSGLFINESRNFTGKTILKEIGLNLEKEEAVILEDSDILFVDRKPVTYKNKYGKLTVIAGSPMMMGASLLAHESAISALRSGAGLCSLAVPKSLSAVYQTRVKEETLIFLSDKNGLILFDEDEINEIIRCSNSIALGMGMGRENGGEILKIIKHIAENFTGTLILDADGLNALSLNKAVLKNKKCSVILTPHIGEFSRLTEYNKETILNDAKTLSHELGAVIALKSATTIITNGKETVLNITGSPCMAKGGSGDVLSGIIGALSLSKNPFEAAGFGCYIFGKAGERAQKNNASDRSVIASDLIGCI